jgi:hypothetical protein
MKAITIVANKFLFAAILTVAACQTIPTPHLQLVPGVYKTENIQFLYKHVGQRMCVTGWPIRGAFAAVFLLEPMVVDDVWNSGPAGVSFAHSTQPISATKIYTVCGRVVHKPVMGACGGADCDFFELDGASVREH